jgi:hypothetical protein
VTVLSDLTGTRLIETATFCRIGDEKRPALVGLPTFTTEQICPDDLTKNADEFEVAEGAPPVWFVRVVFDMLLNPTVEDLIPDPVSTTGALKGTIATTNPVSLRCNNVDILYDGYYAPNGNRVSYPLGPGLFIQPTAPLAIPTGASCEVAVRDKVTNKKGDKVQNGAAPFKFKTAPMVLRFSDPDPADEGASTGEHTQDLDTEVAFFWTAPLRAPINTADFQIFEGPNIGDGPNAAVCGTGGTAVPAGEIVAAPAGPAAGSTALIMLLHATDPDHAWKPETTYRIQFGPTAKALTSQGSTPGTPDGAFPSDYKLCFHTPAAT